MYKYVYIYEYIYIYIGGSEKDVTDDYQLPKRKSLTEWSSVGFGMGAGGGGTGRSVISLLFVC
jgi:hypothetical protein